MDRNLICSSRCTSANLSFFNEIVLGRTEKYDASLFLYRDFCKSTDCRDGIELKFRHPMVSLPFEYAGSVFNYDEMSYLCSQFSTNTNQAISTPKQLYQHNKGCTTKRLVRNKYHSNCFFRIYSYLLPQECYYYKKLKQSDSSDHFSLRM